MENPICKVLCLCLSQLTNASGLEIQYRSVRIGIKFRLVIDWD